MGEVNLMIHFPSVGQFRSRKVQWLENGDEGGSTDGLQIWAIRYRSVLKICTFRHQLTSR